MVRNILGKSILFLLLSMAFQNCKKSDPPAPTPVPPPVVVPPPTATVLKEASSTPVGAGINYELFRNNSKYSALVKAQFDRVTAEWEMKHGGNVKNDGSYDFARTDDFFNLTQAGGLKVHGHTLAWHQGNNGSFLRSLSAAVGPNLLVNPSFENGHSNWLPQVSTTAPTAATITLVTTDAQAGTQATKVDVSTPGPNAYSVQLVSDNFNVTSGTVYKLTYWAKAAANGQSLRAVAQGTSFYAQLDQALTTTWAMYSFNFLPTEGSVSVKFHFPSAGTFYLDNLNVSAAASSQDPVLVKNALQSWVTSMVTRYKGKVTGWDVANEVVADGTGSLRTSANTWGSGGDLFFWADHLGRGYIADAFRWANAADPDAKLFINDYNLESDGRKLDSMLKIVNELKAANVPIHGVGTQMHVNINTSNSGIDMAFQKMAATGLLVHVSEVDVRVNPSNQNPFTVTQAQLDQQAQKYKYIAESYFKYVPAAQRYGITVWNVTDADSWLNTGTNKDAPTLFDNNFNKKPAFTGFLQGLK